jgi:hypothetical protein
VPYCGAAVLPAVVRALHVVVVVVHSGGDEDAVVDVVVPLVLEGLEFCGCAADHDTAVAAADEVRERVVLGAVDVGVV